MHIHWHTFTGTHTEKTCSHAQIRTHTKMQTHVHTLLIQSPIPPTPTWQTVCPHSPHTHLADRLPPSPAHPLGRPSASRRLLVRRWRRRRLTGGRQGRARKARGLPRRPRGLLLLHLGLGRSHEAGALALTLCMECGGQHASQRAS